MRQTIETPQGMASARACARALIACTDPEIRQVLTRVLKEFGLQPLFLERLEDVRILLGQPETVIVFIQIECVKVGLREILKAADRRGPKIPVVVCSEFYDKDIYMEAMSQGAFDFLATPYRHEEVAWVVNNAVRRIPQPPGAHAA